MRTLLFIYLFIQCGVNAFSQTAISGKVFEQVEGKKQPLAGAAVSWINTSAGTLTDENGYFSLDDKQVTDRRLIISFVGYTPDTIAIKDTPVPLDIVLHRTSSLGEVEVLWEREATMVSVKTIRTEILTSKELKKAACCNLGESFETNPSVDVTIKDAVSGSKELQVLGLSGAYTQVLTENVPLIHGLGLTHGLNGIPGTLIDAIHIVKGPGSVVFGHESISGMINVDLKDPEQVDRLFINGYLDQNLRKEINLDKGFKAGENLSALLSVHADHYNNKIDQNGDSFLDMPLLTTFNILNKWKYNNRRGLMSQNSVKYLHEDRAGGQFDFDFSRKLADSSAYGQRLNTRRIEFYGRTGYVIPSAIYKSIGVQYALINHWQNGFYGFKPYSGDQRYALIRMLYNRELGKNNSLNMGISYQHNELAERYDTLAIARKDQTPGIFIENTFQGRGRITLITGIRADYFHKNWFLTPRANLKYALTERTDFRLSAGTGFREADILAENPAILTSARKIVINGPLEPEKAMNIGMNLDHSFTIAYRKGSLSADIYRTVFSNKIMPDLDSDPSKAIFSNLDGKAYADNLQIETSYKILKPVELKLAYKYLDVIARLNDGRRIKQPYIARHRFLGTLFYESFDRKWNANFVMQWYGEKKLPKVNVHHGEDKFPEYSKPYSVFNTQLTRKLKNAELYAGIENLFNFTQDEHILGADDPYGLSFDTSYIWGPLEGRKIYIGFRYIIK